ncbi:hypothetical protein NP493_339g02042 [Ridgeia piscesae]|uniref:Eukaryotic translation initiation factor 3 subunit K n=1 Tax=Ridgeia piscesae TaxID=27915 RepID=A0AAD9NVN3_RIDPI|nr:hypothetical protein NP493_339g02042 [Ridgeia piscesae]
MGESAEMKEQIAELLKGIDRYNPENLPALESYVETQAIENTYDLEANLAVLKLYQFNPTFFQTSVTGQILLKALMNMPHTDFVLCKALIDTVRLEEETLYPILYIANQLETCQFREFWTFLEQNPGIIIGISGFVEAIKKFVCHVINITYQTIHIDLLTSLLGNISDEEVKEFMRRHGWKRFAGGEIFIANQEENVKTKNIKENINFDSVAGIMASS